MGALGFENGVQLVDLVNYGDSVASIGVFAGFDNPYVTHLALFLDASLHLFLLFLDVCLALLVICQKPLILWVLDSFLYMKGQRNGLEQIPSS